jgi:hypothetical protein
MTDLATADETMLEANHGLGALRGTMRRTIMTTKMMLRRSLKDVSARRMYIDRHCVTGGGTTMLVVDTGGA